MKISSDPSHPDYYAKSPNTLVFLDGVRLNNCIHADDQANTVTVQLTSKEQYTQLLAELNPNSKILGFGPNQNADSNLIPNLLILCGHVTIVLPHQFIAPELDQ